MKKLFSLRLGLSLFFFLSYGCAQTPSTNTSEQSDDISHRSNHSSEVAPPSLDDSDNGGPSEDSSVTPNGENGTQDGISLSKCKRDPKHAVYTNDLPTWRFGDNAAKGLGWLPDGEWTVGTAVLSETIKYDLAKKKAAVFEGAGVGASFRFYRDVETVGSQSGGKKEKLRLHQIKAKCRAASLELATGNTLATPMFSITPAVFAAKPLNGQEFRVEPAIMLGFFQDLINIGVGFNLTGDDGDVGDAFLLFSLGFGFNFGGFDSDNTEERTGDNQ